MSRPRRVAAVLPSFAGGGAERVTLNLLTRLDPQRFAPLVIALDASGPLRGLVPTALPVLDLRRTRLRYAVPALLTAIRRAAPDVVFSSLGYVNFALAAARDFFPGRLVLREANLPSLSLPEAPHPRLSRFGYRFLYRRADLVLATSDRMRRELEDLQVPLRSLRILRNPVQRDLVRRQAASPHRVPGPGLRLVAAGRLTRQKGFDRLISLLNAFTDVHLTILGEGPKRRDLAVLAAELRVRVDLPGFVSDAPAWFAGADAVVIPSRWEGMPNVALEALAAGTPVIATPEAGGLGELAAAPTRAVLIASMGSEFAKALADLVPRHDLSLRPSLLPNDYDAAVVARHFEVLLDEIADRY